MARRIVMFTFFGFLLVACGGGRTPVPAVTVQPPVETEPYPAAGPTEVSVEAPYPVDSAAGEGRVFLIVPEESTASYTVDEEFFNGAVEQLGKKLGFFTTVGATNEIEGQITLGLDDNGNPTIQGGKFTVVIRSLESDDSRRDNKIRTDFLESNKYPLAVFVPITIEGLSGPYVEGQAATFKMTGQMTIREVSQTVTFDVTARISGDTLTGVATTTILMTDFGFEPPEIQGFMKAENEVLLTINFTAKEQK